jgi:hypothetical protein
MPARRLVGTSYFDAAERIALMCPSASFAWWWREPFWNAMIEVGRVLEEAETNSVLDIIVRGHPLEVDTLL